MEESFIGKAGAEEGGSLQKSWEGLLAVIKLVSRRVLGRLKKTSSWCHTSKNMDLEIGDQCLLTQD